MVDIYVLECEDGNVYVGKTTKGIKRLKQHIKGRGAEWTKLHKPTKVMEYYTDAKDSDERKVTNQMIKKYGAKKVRGAGLTKRKMSKKEISNLNKKVGFTDTGNKKTRISKKKVSGKKKTTTRTKKTTKKTKSKFTFIAPGYKEDSYGRLVRKTASDYAKDKSTTLKKRKPKSTKKKSSKTKRKKSTPSTGKKTRKRSTRYRKR